MHKVGSSVNASGSSVVNQREGGLHILIQHAAPNDEHPPLILSLWLSRSSLPLLHGLAPRPTCLSHFLRFAPRAHFACLGSHSFHVRFRFFNFTFCTLIKGSPPVAPFLHTHYYTLPYFFLRICFLI